MIKLNFTQRLYSAQQKVIAVSLRRLTVKLYKLYKKYNASYADICVMSNGAIITLKINDAYIIQDFSKLPEGK